MKGAVQFALGGGGATVGARPDDDHYPTPGWLAAAMLDAWAAGGGRAESILDAGAGDGRLLVAARDRTGARMLAAVEADPARADACGAICADFLTWAEGERAIRRRWDLVISNPPFRLWDEFVRAMLPLVAPGGTCLVLGFVHVLGGQGRAAWWRKHPPSRIWLSPRRASFTSDGATDSRDSAWFSWEPGPRNAEVRWLETERTT